MSDVDGLRAEIERLKGERDFAIKALRQLKDLGTDVRDMQEAALQAELARLRIVIDSYAASSKAACDEIGRLKTLLAVTQAEVARYKEEMFANEAGQTKKAATA